MITLRNIEKRRELQQNVYKQYRPLTEEECREHDNEVGAAFRGYETAMRDIIQLIVNGDRGKWDADTKLLCIKDYIIAQLNGKATKNIFRFSEVPSTQMLGYIDSTVKNELIQKGHSNEEAEQICKSFIEYPALRESIIERDELDSIRICEHCGAPMNEGYLVNDFDTYCSEECARAATAEMGWTKEQFEQHLANADNEDSCVYWTQWEG